MKSIVSASRNRILCWELWKRYGDADRRNDRESVIRSDPPSPLPLPALCAQIFGKGRFARTSATCHHHRHHTERTEIELKETTAMLRFSGGDARKLLNILELVVESDTEETVVITDDMVTERLQQNPLAYDKDGEMHYDIISAFIKSIRGSDPDGAIYWLARMVEGGEDPAFIARRLVISAAEDIGLANPNALLLANACFETLMKIGWPEGRIPLAETTIYLATSPKSNSAYSAINDALELVRSTGNLPVPLHLRNAPTKLMKQLGYGQEYKYAHSYEGNFVKQQFLPDELKEKRIWQPQNNAAEQKHAERMQQLWGERFK